MPGTGKTTVGRALAERLHFSFLDADDLIRQTAGLSLPEILRERGIDEFLAMEGRIGAALHCQDTVVATGGSMVLSEAAMKNLKENGLIVWLETPLSRLRGRIPEDLTDRGIAATPGMTLEELYRQREPLYARWADLIVASRPDRDNTARQVEQVLRVVGAL
jgi:shikimate kinase